MDKVADINLEVDKLLPQSPGLPEEKKIAESSDSKYDTALDLDKGELPDLDSIKTSSDKKAFNANEEPDQLIDMKEVMNKVKSNNTASK